MDLFRDTEQKNINAAAPLAVRMRPRTLDEFVGQDEFVGPGKLLWRMLKADRLSSLIFYGPPGTGKTTLAGVIARHSSAEFVPTNATSVGVKDIRIITAAARDRLVVEGRRTVLFLDEIHRFSRSQQDVLLSDVENGTVVLIGATTENPFFSVNSPLVSRSTIFQFHPLTADQIARIITTALTDEQRGLGHYQVDITDEATEYLAVMSDGDARRALTALEIGVLSQQRLAEKTTTGDLPTTQPVTTKEDTTTHLSVPNGLSTDTGPVAGVGPADKAATLTFDKSLAIESIQRKAIVSDRSGDNHYDLASALQKSMRGSDPDATVYWLARLIVGGEDPRFIARRIAVCAAEDVGNADPMATVLAAAAVQVSEFVGLPEAQLPLAQAAIYIACAPKSNRSAQAVWSAVTDIENGRTAPVPDHLRDSHYHGAKRLGHGESYRYPHSDATGYVAQTYLPAEFERQYYLPSGRGNEEKIARFLQEIKQLRKKMSKNGEKS